MKKSSFYRSVSQTLFLAGILSAVIIVKYPLTIFIWVLMLLIAAEQLIIYKQLYVVENKVSESESKKMVSTQRMVARIIQIVILISGVLMASQTFHKIKF
ncbi:hypothetical protein WG954_16425 [Lacibacter sp. H375]|uniref:hypothetical protein n=1 Tax=Lacibacter sp. H375 TaxID=3133424 RepID=UPI0030C1842E